VGRNVLGDLLPQLRPVRESAAEGGNERVISLAGFGTSGCAAGSGNVGVVVSQNRMKIASVARARRRSARRIAFRKAAVLDHGDTSKRERRSIVAQRHAVQGAEWITRFERTYRGCNQDSI
jgi:hypothetical protein